MICISCKRDIPDGSTYCNRCGKKQSRGKKKRTKRPNGTGSIIKLPGKRKKPYQAVITLGRELVDGASVQKRLSLGTFATITEATKALGEHTPEGTTDLYSYTVEDVYNAIKEEYFPSLSPSGVSSHTSAWPRFSSIQHQKMRDIKTQHFQQIVDNAMTVKRSKNSSSRPLSREGKAKIKNLASILCRWAIKNDIIDKNYAEFIVLPPADSLKKRNFTDPELTRLSLAAKNDDTAKITLILNYSGARINELLTMPKSAVSLENRVMVGGSKTEAGKDREIPLHHKILPYISYFMSLPGDLLITTPSGEAINYNTFLKHRFYPLLDRLQIPYKEDGKNILTPHRSRHTFVSKSVAAGVQKEVLKEVVGHAKYSTTVEKYGDDLDLDLKVRNIDKIV